MQFFFFLVVEFLIFLVELVVVAVMFYLFDILVQSFEPSPMTSSIMALIAVAVAAIAIFYSHYARHRQKSLSDA